MGVLPHPFALMFLEMRGCLLLRKLWKTEMSSCLKFVTIWNKHSSSTR